MQQLIFNACIPYSALLFNGACIKAYSLLVECYTDDVCESALSLLSVSEQLRFKSYRDSLGAINFLLGRILIRYALAKIGRTSPSLVTIAQDTPFSKPTSPLASFNISHSQGVIVGAFSADIDCGIDVENSSRTFSWSDVVDYSFPPDLRDHLYSAPAARRQALFYQAWTYLEAGAKLYGQGLSALSETRTMILRYGLDLGDPRFVGHLAVPMDPAVSRNHEIGRSWMP